MTKYQLKARILELLREEFRDSEPTVVVTDVDNLNFCVRVGWGEASGPRYFNVKVSEPI